MRNLEANQEAMQIFLKSANLIEFKNHQDLSVNFGERTEISGDNGKGKSSISEAITWSLYGTDMNGSKLDPTPTTHESDGTAVSLLLNVDGKDLLLGRELKSGKTKYIINDVPSKATEFNEILDQMFDKDLFLSLFNPSYFFTMHWQKQRDMLLQYITAPANKEVLKTLPEVQAKKLADLVKKHSLADLEKIYRDKRVTLDKQRIASQSRVQTLKEQLGAIGSIVPMSSLNLEKKRIDEELDGIDTDQAEETNARIQTLNTELSAIRHRIKLSVGTWPNIRDRKPEKECYSCGQSLQGAAVEKVQKELDELKATHKDNHSKLVAERKKLEAEIAELAPVDISEQLDKKISLNAKLYEIKHEMEKHESLESAKKLHNEAVKAEADTLAELNESIFIIDAIKAFHANEAELQADKVQALFDNLSIKLFEKQKNAEIKPTFEIEMDGKGYAKLSTAERIRAGLELRDVLSEQSGVIAPVFVDNAESITKFKEPNGQLIIGKVVAGQELEIKGEQE